ncbi:MAG: acyl-CoA synthetase [Actinobacteria bacterium]|nr:acyl-CoA synthetase [Actinomycetota bacterium]
MEFNFADMFEAIVDVVPERSALVVGDQRRTFAEMEERGNRLAHHLQAAGIRPGEHIGIYAYNGVEWVEGMVALYKIRAVAVNINYRYVENELRYLCDNADLVAIIAQREFAPRLAAVRDDLPMLRHVIVAEDGSGASVDGLDFTDYEEAVASGASGRDFGLRSGDDIHMIYTGGTTGMPKGVMWRQEDIFYALCGGIDAYSNTRIERPEELSERAAAAPAGGVSFPIAPLMHGAGQVSTIRGLIHGDTTVLTPRFDAEAAWRLVDAEKINLLGITGDAMARPLADTLERIHEELDLSSLISIGSSAAIFSQSIKDQLMELLPNIVVVDSVGATETGMNGIKVAQKGEKPRGGPATVQPALDSIVVDEDLRPVEPGSGVIGRVARTGNIPLGYYKDPERSAQVFFEQDGKRYSIPGDFATVEADGQITLLGRGSIMINTGGEKVFPEEVEGVLKSHPEVFDVLVVGVPDERWGERVVAVVQPREGCTPTVEELSVHCRKDLAAYKAPKQVFLVDAISRAPSGKPDYPWANEYARTAAAR